MYRAQGIETQKKRTFKFLKCIFLFLIEQSVFQLSSGVLHFSDGEIYSGAELTS